MKRRHDIRVAIGEQNGPHSEVWHFWCRDNEVYVVHGNIGHVQKFSFHTPNVCRLAFTKQHGIPPTMKSRASHEWRREKTPEIGTGKVVRVLRALFPSDVLSTSHRAQLKKVNWVKPAPAGGATVLDLSFTKEDQATILDQIKKDSLENNHDLVAYQRLPNGEAFCITKWFAYKTKNTLRVSAKPGEDNDILILPSDPTQSGRPIRLSIFSNPKDGDLIQVWEFGGYLYPKLTDEQWKEKIAETPNAIT